MKYENLLKRLDLRLDSFIDRSVLFNERLILDWFSSFLPIFVLVQSNYEEKWRLDDPLKFGLCKNLFQYSRNFVVVKDCNLFRAKDICFFVNIYFTCLFECFNSS